MNDATLGTAAELRQAYATGTLSPVEVMQATLARAEREGALLNAFMTLDGDRAIVQARRAEAALGESCAERLPLLGVPVSVKDLTATAGLRTTRGSLAQADHVPDLDAPAVARIRAAGGIVFAKTNTCEGGWKADAGNLLIGPTANPWDRSLSSGGSSGGAAAAVAAGIGPLATGTDGAGSIRIPAAFCGVVGFKPTNGLIAYVPPCADQLAALGPLTRTVADAALLAAVMAGADPRDPYSVPNAGFLRARGPATERRLRVAVSYDLGFASIDDPQRAALATTAAALRDAGHIVEQIEAGLRDPYWILDTVIAGFEAAEHPLDDPALDALLDPGHLALIERGRSIDGRALVRAIAARAQLANQLQAMLDGYDLLLTATVPLSGFALGSDGPDGDAALSWTPFTYVFNLTGQPAISVPAGLQGNGLPLAVQLVGRRFDDLTVLAGGRACEQANPWSYTYPKLWTELKGPHQNGATPNQAAQARAAAEPALTPGNEG